jgi:hypothetical protein
MEVFTTTSSEVEIEMKSLALIRVIWTKEIPFNFLWQKIINIFYCLGAPKRESSPLFISWMWKRIVRDLYGSREICFYYWNWGLESWGMSSEILIVACRCDTRSFPRFNGEYKKWVIIFLDSSQGEISQYAFNHILEGQKTSWDKAMWVGKDYEEAITFAEASFT